MVLKLEKMFRVLHRGFGRREITWVQTGFFRCADGFPVWKGVKLQGSQTSKKSRSAVRKQNCMVLKPLMLPARYLKGNGIAWCSNWLSSRNTLWKWKKLQDTQIHARRGRERGRFGNGRNCRVLKRQYPNFSGLEEGKITWYSSPTAVKNHECAGLEEDKIA